MAKIAAPLRSPRPLASLDSEGESADVIERTIIAAYLDAVIGKDASAVRDRPSLAV